MIPKIEEIQYKIFQYSNHKISLNDLIDLYEKEDLIDSLGRLTFEIQSLKEKEKYAGIADMVNQSL